MNRITDAFSSNINRSFVYDLNSNKSLNYRDLFIKSYSLSKYLKNIGLKKNQKL